MAFIFFFDFLPIILKYFEAQIPIFGLSAEIFLKVIFSFLLISTFAYKDLRNFKFLLSILVSLCFLVLSKISKLSLFKFIIIFDPIEKVESGVFLLSMLKCFSIATTPSGIDATEEKISLV